MKTIHYIIIGIILISSIFLCIGYVGNRKWEKGYSIGYNSGKSIGIEKGIDICEDNYKSMLERYIPNDNCILVLHSKYISQQPCIGDSLYKLIQNHNGMNNIINVSGGDE
jgi:hypothetical protein